MESVNFDRAADYYDKTRGFPDGIAGKIGRFIAEKADLSKQSTVLEIGIGTGRIALPLAPHVRYIAGVDIAIDMMKVLQDKLGSETVFPVLADGHDLPYARNSFDAVIIVHVLHLVPDPVQILKDVQRVLKPSGKLLHCFSNRGDNSNPLVAAWSANRPERKHGHNWEITKTALDKSGWHLESEEQFFYPHPETPRDFLYPLESRAWSSTWAVSDEEMATGINAVKVAIADHYDNDYERVIEQHATFTMQILSPTV